MDLACIQLGLDIRNGDREIADFRLLGLPQIVELICAVINVLQVPVEVRARELARARERERVSHLEDFQDLRTRSRLTDMCNDKCSFSACRCSATCWPTSRAEGCTREEVSDKHGNKVEEEQRSRRTKDI